VTDETTAVGGRRTWSRTVRDGLFGDELGVVVFLGSLCFAMVYWRAGVFITDNETLVRTLEALAEGRVWIEPATGGSVFDAPGAEVRDGFVYGRNYGQLVVSLPALWLLEFLARVADLRVALVAFWHLAALAFTVRLGRVLERERAVGVAGSVLVFALFVVNLARATRFVDPPMALLALQVTSLLAVGFVAVFFYRLVAFQYDRRLGVLAGSAGVVVLPVGFWATIPKRHVFTVLVCVVVLYAFARSREPDATGSIAFLDHLPVYRAAAYALVGFLTWIHAAEGLFVFLALVAVDVPTAPANDRRTLAFVAAVFAVSLLPTVATNLLVTGDPIRPPRTLGGAGLTTPASAEPTDAGPDGPLLRLLDTTTDLFVIEAAGWLLSVVSGIARESLVSMTEHQRVYQTFVRSAGAERTGGQLAFWDTNLSVFESAPILGAGVAVAAAFASRLVRTPRDTLERIDATAALAGALVVAFLLVYASKLPLHVQITQRYILPVYPLALYLLVRSDLVRVLVDDLATRRALLWSYGAGVLLGTQLFLAYVLARDLTVAEAARANALLALALAAFLALAVGGSVLEERLRTTAAVTTGLAGAAGTLFLLVSGVHYFGFVGEFVLPVVQAVSDVLASSR